MSGLTEWTVGVVHVAINYVATINDFRCQIKWSRTQEISVQCFQAQGQRQRQVHSCDICTPFFWVRKSQCWFDTFEFGVGFEWLQLFFLMLPLISSCQAELRGNPQWKEFSGMIEEIFSFIKTWRSTLTSFQCIYLLPAYRFFLFYLNKPFILI